MNKDAKCLFCKRNSSDSQSVEHIIPESLGNHSHVLPRGIVCDRCNNYFAHAVEKPFLETPWVRVLRFHQEIVSKKGRVPPLYGLMQPGVPVVLTRWPKEQLTSVAVPSPAYENIAQARTGQIILPIEGPWPSGTVVSRFLAKVALEAMVLRVVHLDGGVDYFREEPQLDCLRKHAREGKLADWPVSIRRIYAADGATLGEYGNSSQIVHEFDFLVTKKSEWFFVLAIFGLEFAINLGGPEIAGYEEWLTDNEGSSPLYSTQNEHIAGKNWSDG